MIKSEPKAISIFGFDSSDISVVFVISIVDPDTINLALLDILFAL